MKIISEIHDIPVNKICIRQSLEGILKRPLCSLIYKSNCTRCLLSGLYQSSFLNRYSENPLGICAFQSVPVGFKRKHSLSIKELQHEKTILVIEILVPQGRLKLFFVIKLPFKTKQRRFLERASKSREHFAFP